MVEVFATHLTQATRINRSHFPPSVFALPWFLLSRSVSLSLFLSLQSPQHTYLCLSLCLSPCLGPPSSLQLEPLRVSRPLDRTPEMCLNLAQPVIRQLQALTTIKQPRQKSPGCYQRPGGRGNLSILDTCHWYCSRRCSVIHTVALTIRTK